MFDYTKVAANQIISDFKKIAYILGVATQIFYIAYLIYAVAARTGVLWVNVILLIFSVAYFAFEIVMRRRKAKDRNRIKADKSINLTVKKIYKYGKLVLRFYPLVLAVYGMYTATQSPSFLSVLLLCFTVIGWAMQIIFDLLIAVAKNRLSLLLDGVKADVNEITKPIVSTMNFFKKITGKEVKEPEEPTKNQLKLREKVEEYRAEREEKKEREKQESAEKKKQKKADEKERKAKEKKQKAQDKRAAKAEKAALKSSASVEKKLLRAAEKKEKRRRKQRAAETENKAECSRSQTAAELALAATDETEKKKKTHKDA
ncbi:MAG: hypothetical protein SPH68_01940 [Candidatus Borkfalkiaceae bacterium]|nr:hypothetical protein [Clostridia bacterium]MDY6222905.1 hypothetical protein [Christensenellaceae bacterium]